MDRNRFKNIAFIAFPLSKGFILWYILFIMSKIYSKDLRECVVQNILDGMSRKEAARIFKIGSNTVTRWLRWHRDRGDLSTPTRGRYKVRKLSDEELIHFLESNIDSTLEEIAAHFDVTRNAVWKRLKILNITRKKNHTIRRA